jgi:hypothetical protein
MRRELLVAGLALALTARGAQAQPEVDPRLERRLDARTRTAVVAIVDEARRAGLPTEPLIQRALEGSNAKASSAVIEKVLRNRLHDLTQARQALGPSSSEAEISAGAEALRAGIPTSELQKLRAARSGVQIATTLNVVSNLVEQGVPGDTVVAITQALARVSASDEQILGMQRDVQSDILAGRPAAVAASARARALEQVILAGVGPNSGTPGGSLPSGRGSTASPTNPLAGQAAGTAVGARGVADAPAKPLQRNLPPPLGKPRKRP